MNDANINHIIELFIGEHNYKSAACAVGIQGGYARGTFSEYSDIDILFVFNKESEAIGIFKGEKRYKGYTFEVIHLFLDNLSVNKWKPKLRYIYSNETIVLMENNKELSFIIEKAHMTEKEQIDIIVYNVKKINNLGVVHSSNCNEKLLCRAKTDLVAEHLKLNTCNERLISLIFAINKEFLPSLKWRYTTLRKLKWLPDEFEKKLEHVSCYSSFSTEEYFKRNKFYTYLLDNCMEKCAQLDLLPQNVDEYFYDQLESYIENV